MPQLAVSFTQKTDVFTPESKTISAVTKISKKKKGGKPGLDKRNQVGLYKSGPIGNVYVQKLLDRSENSVKTQKGNTLYNYKHVICMLNIHVQIFVMILHQDCRKICTSAACCRIPIQNWSWFQSSLCRHGKCPGRTGKLSMRSFPAYSPS